MSKKSSSSLVKDVLGYLKRVERPCSIKEISEGTDTDRKSVRKYLNELVETGLLEMEKQGRKKLYYIQDYRTSNTYFNLPLDEEQRKKVETVFGYIQEQYMEKNDEKVSKAKAQKILVGAMKESDSRFIPFGRYRYGLISVASFESGKNYHFERESIPEWEEFREIVDRKIEKYSGLSFNEVLEEQYRNWDMDLHLSKQRLIHIILDTSCEKEEFIKELYNFVYNSPEMDDEAEDILMDFVSVAPKLKPNTEKKSILLDCFKEVWNMISVYVLQEDLGEFYSDKLLDTRLRGRKENAKEDAEEVLTMLFDEVEYQEPDKKFKKHQGAGKELSEEEKKEREKELEEMDGSEMAGKLGLDG